jgi:hypothetical protein
MNKDLHATRRMTHSAYVVQAILADMRDPTSELHASLIPVLADALRQQGPTAKIVKKRRRPLEANDLRLWRARLVGTVTKAQHLSLGDASVYVKTHALAY